METDRESRLGGLVLMGVSSSELLSSSSDSSDWISSTMDRRGPGKMENRVTQIKIILTSGQKRKPNTLYLVPASVQAQSPNLNWSQSSNWNWKDLKGPTAVQNKETKDEERAH